MSDITHHKVVGALPETLEPNAIYFVLVGTSFQMYVTDDSANAISSNVETTYYDTAEFIDETETYFYMGWANVAAEGEEPRWLIRRTERATAQTLEATVINNTDSEYADVVYAWQERASLTYSEQV